jgi:hypothetical protein
MGSRRVGQAKIWGSDEQVGPKYGALTSKSGQNMESQRVGQLSEAKIWGSDEQVTVKIWGPDEQVIGASSNSSAGASHLSLTYPLTVNHFLNHAI